MVIMWLNLGRNSLYLGLGWAVIGLICLAYATKGFSFRPAEFKLDNQIDEFI
jgi:hypothetical protein